MAWAVPMRALVLKWTDECPHCQRTMQSLPDLMDALQGYSGSLGMYFSTEPIPPRSASVRRSIEQVEGVPMLQGVQPHGDHPGG